LFGKEHDMRQLRDDTHLILDGEVRVYRRERSKRWQAAFVIDEHTIYIASVALNCVANTVLAEFYANMGGNTRNVTAGFLCVWVTVCATTNL
jgi:hypothetical protein